MEYNYQIKNQMIQVERQVNEVLVLMDSENAIKDVISKLEVASSMLDQLNGFIVSTNLARCVQQNNVAGGKEGLPVEEAMKLMVKSR